MTGRTHDLAAFTTLTVAFALSPLQEMTLGTLLVAFGANMIGGLAPDLDQPSASLYYRIRGGTILAKIIDPLLGSHRLLSHSILGAVIFGFIAKFLLNASSGFLIVDRDIVWWAFMLGFISHLVMDIITKDGIPLLFPIPLRVGIPPLRFLRLKTGGFIEKSLIFPGLLFVNGYFIFSHYGKFLTFMRHFIM